MQPAHQNLTQVTLGQRSCGMSVIQCASEDHENCDPQKFKKLFFSLFLSPSPPSSKSVKVCISRSHAGSSARLGRQEVGMSRAVEEVRAKEVGRVFLGEEEEEEEEARLRVGVPSVACSTSARRSAQVLLFQGSGAPRELNPPPRHASASHPPPLLLYH